MGFVNIYKRVSAFTYQNTVLYSVLISVLQIINQFMEDPIKAIITVGLVIVGLYLIFANSEIEDHQG
jgi:predicted transporter